MPNGDGAGRPVKGALRAQEDRLAAAGDGPLYIREAYANAYNELTKPDRVFVASQYFRKRWVPLLGPTLAWIIIALRQHCYTNKVTGERRDWCLLTQEELAAEVGISIATLKRTLAHEYAGKFILQVANRYRYDQELRKQVREESRYRIRMDDPLLPEDELRLREMVAERLEGVTVDPETGQLDMLGLIDRMLNNGPDLQLNLSCRSNDSQVEDRNGAPDRLEEAPAEAKPGDDIVETSAESPLAASTGTDQASDSQEDLAYAGAQPVSQDELAQFVLGEDQLLVPWEDGFLAVSLVEAAKHDIRRGWLGFNEDYQYSVAQALGEGPDDFSPEEQARIDRLWDVKKELGDEYERLGAFSLVDALTQYFTPQFTTKLLDGQSPAERRRIADWVAYTRKARGLRNPAGFLRRSIESKQDPPASD
jgi:hypothetical protein